MIRSTFKPKALAPTRRDRSDEFASFKPRARAPAAPVIDAEPIIEAGWLRAVGVKPLAKTPGRKRQDIRDSARGEECLVRIPGVCRGGTEHTIWSHAPLGAAGKGRGIKSIDVAGAYCCTACDAALDQAQRPAGMTRDQVLLDWFKGHMRSLVRLAQKGLL
jgi:hypothetical protein